jgi:bacteriorhodopsin
MAVDLLTESQYTAMYVVLSFALVSMMVTTMYVWFHALSLTEKSPRAMRYSQYKNAALISGLVTFIGAYHYIRIFTSWASGYQYVSGAVAGNGKELATSTLIGVPLNDAFRYVDWLLTVPLLLTEILFVMEIEQHVLKAKAKSIGLSAVLMIIFGYYGELVVTGDLTPRWMCWIVSMVFFQYIVYELLIGLSPQLNSEANPVIAGRIRTTQVMTVTIWCTYPIVYLFPMFGANATQTIILVQICYCISDVIAKCGVGVMICHIACAKCTQHEMMSMKL